ncbi:hypothetical protein [Pasteuria penetrans]|uniref:hypothetical protein n=1 Tax=Pasteuria penetrans TaxID=86005 RepID=UPI0011EE0825|nr:hypothetical protein [Pasteuria penetrans]
MVILSGPVMGEGIESNYLLEHPNGPFIPIGISGLILYPTMYQGVTSPYILMAGDNCHGMRGTAKERTIYRYAPSR